MFSPVFHFYGDQILRTAFRKSELRRALRNFNQSKDEFHDFDPEIEQIG